MINKLKIKWVLMPQVDSLRKEYERINGTNTLTLEIEEGYDRDLTPMAKDSKEYKSEHILRQIRELLRRIDELEGKIEITRENSGPATKMQR